MTKYILPLTKYGLLLMAVFFFSCQPSPADACIKSILEKDEQLGKARNHACEKISLAETIKNYADGLEKLDYSECPPEFENAFAGHIKAWREMIPLVEKYPNMRGEMHDLFDKLEKSEDAETFKPLLKNIWDTWGEVEAAQE